MVTAHELARIGMPAAAGRASRRGRRCRTRPARPRWRHRRRAGRRRARPREGRPRSPSPPPSSSRACFRRRRACGSSPGLLELRRCCRFDGDVVGPDDEHRARRFVHDRARHAAVEQTANRSPAVRADHDQAGVVLGGDGADLLGDRPGRRGASSQRTPAAVATACAFARARRRRARVPSSPARVTTSA